VGAHRKSKPWPPPGHSKRWQHARRGINMPIARPRNSRSGCRRYGVQGYMSVQCIMQADRFTLQDKNAHNDALCSIQDNAAKVKSEKKKSNQYEEEL